MSTPKPIVYARMLLGLLLISISFGLGLPRIAAQTPRDEATERLNSADWAAIQGLLAPTTAISGSKFQAGYLKAAQVSAGDSFGASVAISGDTVVVGVPAESSSLAGVQNSATPTINALAAQAGAAYVFVRGSAGWQQQAYLKASEVSANDQFGWSVAISGDTIVVGSPRESSSTVGVQNSATPTVNNDLGGAGAAYVFVRTGSTWSQQAYFKASQVTSGDWFGWSVGLASNTIVVGAYGEDSNIVGVQNSATPTVNEAATAAGAAYIFVRTGSTWSQQAYLKAAQINTDDVFGWSVAVAGDTVIVGAPGEDTSIAGVQHSATPTVDETALAAGAVFVFTRSGSSWSPQVFVKASQVTPGDQFGYNLAIAGNTIVVGAPYEDSSTSGVQHGASPSVDELASFAGAAFVYTQNAGVWSQQAYLKASNVADGDRFGMSVAIDANTIVVGAPEEDSGIAGVQNSALPNADESAIQAGAAYVYARNATTWSQQSYLKASQVSTGDYFGRGVGVAGDMLVIGIPLEDSARSGIQNSATPSVDELAADSGAALIIDTTYRSYSPLVQRMTLLALLTINSTAIPIRAVTQQGEVFASFTATLPTTIPAGGHIYLSASPSSLQPTLVDDRIIIRDGANIIFQHTYDLESNGELVEIPWEVINAASGHSLTITFVDVSAGLVGATPIYLIWVAE
ncbi:MAG TPA: alpha/beta hydrolase [Herpetosiphon sp.]|uniref:Integrin alpha beta-propellor repeat protein n=1 Tax=Herpetosiphon aurantiacus (strain ATCC 23779 / DSM 785 / 114-95) TaxID=316274 RepID=A9AUP7_HERA2|nr:FG-GAP repeat protein [Herpetosiphon sp.]ABX04574.1 Integrin alpha beta-propellor repeat protein [Herpetosiphon aurantiacus DSM 785]HBW50046.1 alpha/beta hydrolase [Herpetosiphon sp.]